MKNLFAIKPLLLLISLLQGLALLSLHLINQHDIWPHDQPQWQTAFYVMAIGGPVLLLLSLNEKNIRKIFIWVGGFTCIAGLLGYYVGWQAVPWDKVASGSLFFAFAVTMIIAAFKFLMYAQQFSSDSKISYSNLFRLSWRNFLTLALSGAFTLSFCGILMLWAALFQLIKIDLFSEIFRQEWFLYPVLAVVNGFGVIILRDQSKVIDVLTRVQQALMKYLLLILILISIIFICALPITGLSDLWETRAGSTIILWMQALILFFVNAVYQDEAHERPYPLFLHRFVYGGVLLLPLYSAISFYGLFLRIEQYGWTVGRSWGVLIWAVFALFSLGYLYGIIRRRDDWIVNLSWVNIRMGLLVLFCMLMVNTPLLDFRKISVISQMARLEVGKVSYEKFDYSYFRRHLGAPGYQALQSLKTDLKDSHPEIASKIEDIYDSTEQSSKIKPIENFRETLVVWPETENLQQDPLEAIYTHVEKNWWKYQQGTDRYVLAVDLNSDGIRDYLFLSIHKHGKDGQLFTYSNDQWQNHDILIEDDWNEESLNEILKRGGVEAVLSPWKDLKLGELTIRVSP